MQCFHLSRLLLSKYNPSLIQHFCLSAHRIISPLIARRTSQEGIVELKKIVSTMQYIYCFA
jgi:hypothetical protein